MQSTSRIFISSLKSYLDGAFNIFEDKEILDHLNNEIPVVISLLQSVRNYEAKSFLPKPVVAIFNHILFIYEKAMSLASTRYVKPDVYSHTEPTLEHFPSLPIHSNLSNYKKDDTADDTSEYDCNNDYPGTQDDPRSC